MTPSPTASGAGGGLRLRSLVAVERDRAVPVLRDGFVGVYRWHAKRKLREVALVRAASLGEDLVGVTLLDRLAPGVGYVYYLSVLATYRGRGIGGRLLDDALERVREDGGVVVYAAVLAGNAPSRRLFAGRGFREVARKERSWQDGGLGAWGLRSRMRLVSGERLLGRRLPVPDLGP